MLTFAIDPPPSVAALVEAALEHAYGLFLLHPQPSLADLARLEQHGILPRPAFAAWVHYGSRLRACFPGSVACRSIQALQEALAAPEYYRPSDHLWVLLYEALRLYYVESCAGWENDLLEPERVDPIRRVNLGEWAEQYLPDPCVLRAYLGGAPQATDRPSLLRLHQKEPALADDLTLTPVSEETSGDTEAAEATASDPEILVHAHGTLGVFHTPGAPTPAPLPPVSLPKGAQSYPAPQEP